MRKRSAFYLLGMLLVCAFVYSFTIKTIVGINVNWVFIIVTCIMYIIVGALQFPVGKGINLSLISFFMVVAIFSFGKFYTFVLIMPTTFIYKKLYFLLYQQKSGKRMENSTVDSLNTTIIRIIDIGFYCFIIYVFHLKFDFNFNINEIININLLAIFVSISNIFTFFLKENRIRFKNLYRAWLSSLISWILLSNAAYVTLYFYQRQLYFPILTIFLLILITNYFLFVVTEKNYALHTMKKNLTILSSIKDISIKTKNSNDFFNTINHYLVVRKISDLFLLLKENSTGLSIVYNSTEIDIKNSIKLFNGKLVGFKNLLVKLKYKKSQIIKLDFKNEHYFFIYIMNGEVKERNIDYLNLTRNILTVYENISLKEELRKSNNKLQIINDKFIEQNTILENFVDLFDNNVKNTLTTIYGKFNFIIKGNMGRINKEIRESLKNIAKKIDALLLTIEILKNFIKHNEVQIRFTRFPIEKIITELCINKNIDCEYKKGTKWFTDYEKLLFVLHYIISNIQKAGGKISKIAFQNKIITIKNNLYNDLEVCSDNKNIECIITNAILSTPGKNFEIKLVVE